MVWSSILVSERTTYAGANPNSFTRKFEAQLAPDAFWRALARAFRRKGPHNSPCHGVRPLNWYDLRVAARPWGYWPMAKKHRWVYWSRADARGGVSPGSTIGFAASDFFRRPRGGPGLLFFRSGNSAGDAFSGREMFAPWERALTTPGRDY